MIPSKNRLSFELAEEYFFFDPVSGKLYWNKVRLHSRFKQWDPVGTIDKDGYEVVFFAGKNYRITNIIWLLMTGKWPSHEIDHINRNPSDNHWENLRLSKTYSHNRANQKIRSDNTSGYRGVSWSKTAKKWKVSVGDKNFSGFFDDKEEAAHHYDKIAKEKFGEFANLNFPEL